MRRLAFSAASIRGVSTLALLAMSGCASVTVHDSAIKTREPSAAPKKIYVAAFTVRAQDFRINRSDAHSAEIARHAAALLSQQLIAGLNRDVVPAVLLRPGERPPAGSWVLRGKFQRVNSGSASLRIAVGLGAGGSKMETRALLAQAGTGGEAKPFLAMQTTGGSGAQAGLITLPLGGPIAVPMLIAQVGSTVYSGASKGINEDAARTARMIVAATSDYMTRRGFPVRGKPLQPKRDWSAALRGN